MEDFAEFIEEYLYDLYSSGVEPDKAREIILRDIGDNPDNRNRLSIACQELQIDIDRTDLLN